MIKSKYFIFKIKEIYSNLEVPQAPTLLSKVLFSNKIYSGSFEIEKLELVGTGFMVLPSLTFRLDYDIWTYTYVLMLIIYYILFSLILAAFYGVLFSFLVSNFVETKVLELSDRFLPLRHEGMWLISVSDFFFWEHSYMTSDVFRVFLTYLLIRYFTT